MIVFDGIRDFNTDHIFDCGQCFRWRKEEDGSWTGIAGARIANVSFKPESIRSKSGKVIVNDLTGDKLPAKKVREFWHSYLDLGRDYALIKRKLSKGDPVMKEAIKEGSGIRILNQDLWETIVSFIISQNNNIPRIKGCVERLADVAGSPIPINNRAKNLGTFCCGEGLIGNASGKKEELCLKTVPRPEKLAAMNESDLSEVRLGYRAKYLIRAAQEVLERGMPETFEEVLALTGVGPKVANCITLFGLRDMSSFPIDVWMRRVMHELYDFHEDDVKGMAAFAEGNFGELSGIAQQYLFYYIREKNVDNLR